MKFMKNVKPKRCCYPDCFNCPYSDCRYDRLEVEDYTESNNRDYLLYEEYTGEKLHHVSDKDYQSKRHTAYQRKKGRKQDKSEYNQKYYEKNRDKIKQKEKENYNTKKNTARCKKYRKKNIESVKEYQKKYYEIHKEEKKIKARERYYKNKTA